MLLSSLGHIVSKSLDIGRRSLTLSPIGVHTSTFTILDVMESQPSRHSFSTATLFLPASFVAIYVYTSLDQYGQRIDDTGVDLEMQMSELSLRFRRV